MSSYDLRVFFRSEITMADSDVGKLFVGGISRDTTDATLRDHFAKYGNVSSSVIAKDRLIGTPRGFGFVTFSDPSSVDNALRDQHFIAGRPVEVKKAIPRHEQQSNAHQQPQQQQQPYLRQQQQQQQPSQGYSHTYKGSFRNNSSGTHGASNNDQNFRAKKIFVGGLSANLTEEEFRKYFEKFGRITDVVVMYDNNTNRPRGFGFITFDSEEVVEKLMQKSHHELCGKRVEIKKAVPREATRNFNNGSNSRFGGGRSSPAASYSDDNYWPRATGSYVSYPGQFSLSPTYPGCYYGSVYGGGYPVGGYGFFGYGMPMVPSRTPWNGVGVMGVRSLPYGTGFYPTGNGGVALLGMFNGYNGVVDAGVNVKPDQDVNGNTQVPAKDATTRLMNGTRSDVDNSSIKMEKGVVNANKNSRIPDAQVQSEVPPVGQSN